MNSESKNTTDAEGPTPVGSGTGTCGMYTPGNWYTAPPTDRCGPGSKAHYICLAPEVCHTDTTPSARQWGPNVHSLHPPSGIPSDTL